MMIMIVVNDDGKDSDGKDNDDGDDKMKTVPASPPSLMLLSVSFYCYYY